MTWVFTIAFAFLAATALHAEMQTFTLRPVMFIETHLYDGYLRAPQGVFVDDVRKEILVADSRNNLIGIFGFDGMPLFAFGSTKYIREPRQVAVDPAGRILVLERDGTRIRLFNYRGVYLGDLVPPSLPGKGLVTTFAFGPNGLFYVAENSREILVYDYATMKLKRRFGSSGDEEGQFQSIASIAADEKYIYVLDHTAIAVQVFTQRGDFVKGWGKHSMGGANFSLPHAIAVDAKGRIVTVDGLRNDIKYFDIEGRMIGHFGGPGRSPGQVFVPTGVAVDAAGRVYVCERGNSRIQVYEEETLEKPVTVP